MPGSASRHPPLSTPDPPQNASPPAGRPWQSTSSLSGQRPPPFAVLPFEPAITITPLHGVCRMKGATSAWAPYLNILPPNSPLPLSLPPHLWEEVQWPAMERQLAGMREEIENAYAAVAHPQFGLEDFGERPAPASHPRPPASTLQPPTQACFRSRVSLGGVHGAQPRVRPGGEGGGDGALHGRHQPPTRQQRTRPPAACHLAPACAGTQGVWGLGGNRLSGV